MSAEIPYVYTDVDYDMITVTSGGLTATDTARGVSVVVGLLDHAEDVVALARAILAANGNTGHEVVSASSLDSQLPDRGGDIITDLDVALATRTDLTDEHRACYEAILSRVEEIRAERDQALTEARSMRERALEFADDLPAEDLVEPGDEVPALAELADRVSALEERLSLPGKSARSYSQGYEDMREQAMRAASNAPGTPYTPTEAIQNLPLSGDSGAPTGDLGTTHADRPGDFSPCGVSTWDVSASSDLAEVDCVECLRALAQMHGAERPGTGAELPGSDADYDAGFSDGLRMGSARGEGQLSAIADSDGEGPETRPGRSRMTEESDG